MAGRVGQAGLVFPGYDRTKPLDSRRDDHAWRDSLVAARPLGPLHGVRKVLADRLKGTDVKTAADVLGHAPVVSVSYKSADRARMAAAVEAAALPIRAGD